MGQRIEHEDKRFYVGDRVTFNTAQKTRGIEKGRSGTVLAVKDGLATKVVAVKLDDSETRTPSKICQSMTEHARELVRVACGKSTRTIRPRKDIILVPLRALNPLMNCYDGLSLAYASTTHLAQGSTCENSYVILGGRMTSKELAYVQASRHSRGLHLYSTELEAGRHLAEIAARTRPRLESLERSRTQLATYSPLLSQMQRSQLAPLATTITQQHQLNQAELLL